MEECILKNISLLLERNSFLLVLFGVVVRTYKPKI